MSAETKPKEAKTGKEATERAFKALKHLKVVEQSSYLTAPAQSLVDANSEKAKHSLFSLMHELEPSVRDVSTASQYDWLKGFSKELEIRSKRAAKKSIAKSKLKQIFKPDSVYKAKKVNLKQKLQHKLVRVTGSDHTAKQTPCQDEVLLYREDNLIIGAVTDGAGAFALTHYGAKILAHIAINAAKDLTKDHYLLSESEHVSILDAVFLSDLYQKIYLRLAEILYNLRLNPEDALKTFLPTTLQIVIVTPLEYFILSLGDGFVGNLKDIKNINDVIGREDKLVQSNCPPMIGAALMMDNGLSPMDSLDHETRVSIHEETQSFQIVAHGVTQSILDSGLICCSDGFRFANAQGLDLLNFLQANPAGKIQELASLYNLSLLPPIECSDQKYLEILSNTLAFYPKVAPAVLAAIKAEVLQQLMLYKNSSHERTSFLLETRTQDLLTLLIKGNIKGVNNLQEILRVARLVAGSTIKHYLEKTYAVNFKEAKDALWDDLGMIFLN